jgi:DNA-binding response OmpR family regulator
LLRRDLRTTDVPIVIVSALTSPEDVQMGMGAGADVYLGKPVGVDELIRAVRVLVGDPAKLGLVPGTDSQRPTQTQ